MGAFFTVRATESIVSTFVISQTVGGLFITAPMAALPEIFATWSVAKSGQITSAVTSVIGNHAVTLTVAFFPLAMVGLSVENFTLFSTVLCFVALIALLYAFFIHIGSRNSGHGFKLWQVCTLGVVLLIYVAVILYEVSNFLK